MIFNEINSKLFKIKNNSKNYKKLIQKIQKINLCKNYKKLFQKLQKILLKLS
jgi:ubiquinone biosynthesis protein COQ9